MTQNRDRKDKIRARMAATGEPYSEAARQVGRHPVCGYWIEDEEWPGGGYACTGEPGHRPDHAEPQQRAAEHLTWSGPDWYAFPPEPPQGTGLGLGNGRNQRYYWEARRRWAPWQVRQHARMAAELTGGRARHLADWYPEGWAPYHGDTRDLAPGLLT